MIKIKLDCDDGTLYQLMAQCKYLAKGLEEKTLPATSLAFNQSANLVKKLWSGWAMGESLEGIKNIKKPSTQLASSIKVKKDSGFNAQIYTNSQEMEKIENGTPAIEMKLKSSAWLSGRKTRLTKKDKLPYLIIPFRWGTANKDGSRRAHFGNTIPLAVLSLMRSKKFSKSVRTNDTYTTQNVRGENIERSKFDWGSRITESNMGDTDSSGNLTGYDKGMVRMQGGTYFTFRVLSTKSKSAWIIKKVDGIDVKSAVEKNSLPYVEQMIQEGLKADLDLF